MGQSVFIDLTGIKKLQNFMKRVGNSYRKAEAIYDELEDIAIDMRNFIIDGMTNTPKMSRGYKRGNHVHFPSKPGEMPAIDQGGIVKLLGHQTSMKGVEFGVRQGAPYAELLEDGTNKMDARPIIQPTIDHFDPWMEQRLWLKIKEVTK